MSNLLTCVTAPSGNILTPAGRLTFPSLLTPQQRKGAAPDAKAKYNCGLLLPPNADLSILKTAAAEAAKKEWPNLSANLKVKSPFLRAEEQINQQTGERSYGEEFTGWILIRVTSIQMPGFVGPNGQTFSPEPKEIYGGRWARLSVGPFTYFRDGNRGVSLGLRNVMLLQHGTPLGGGSAARAEDDFASVAESGGSTGADESADSIFG